MKLSAPLGTVSTVLAFSSLGNEKDEAIHKKYSLRRFDATRDQEALVEICQNVYGGSDYLPNIASSLAADPQCLFLVMADDANDRPAAVANARIFKHRMRWLEALRTGENHRSRGLARHLTQLLIDLSRSEQHEMYSCTVASNVAMQKVFERVGMKKISHIHQLSFAPLKELPGWKAGDDRAPKPLLQSIGAVDLVDGTARDMQWKTVTCEEELNTVLKQVKADGGIGHLVGLYELLPDSAVHESLRDGRVWKLVDTNHSEDESTGAGAAVFALTRDEKISSLSSRNVCSVAATTNLAFESALWQACCTDRCLSLLDGDTAFTVAFDGAIPIENSVLADALPLADDACLLFGSSSDI